MTVLTGLTGNCNRLARAEARGRGEPQPNRTTKTRRHKEPQGRDKYERELGMSDVDVMLDRVEIKLGGVSHFLRAPSIADSGAWRRKMGKLLSPMAGSAVRSAKGGHVDEAALMEQAIEYMIGDALDGLIDLVPVYDPSIAEAYAGASDVEKMDAAAAMLEVSGPFLERVMATVVRMRRAAV